MKRLYQIHSSGILVSYGCAITMPKYKFWGSQPLLLCLQLSKCLTLLTQLWVPSKVVLSTWILRVWAIDKEKNLPKHVKMTTFECIGKFESLSDWSTKPIRGIK
jgi:hypothetical protein